MSLLRGLAERALGTARPVRSQRAGLLHALNRDASAGDPFVAASESASTSLPMSGDPSSRANAAQPLAAMATREAPADMHVEAHAPLAVMPRDTRDVASPTRRTSGTARRAEAAPPSQRVAARDLAPQAHADASTPDPKPLVARGAALPRESPPTRSLPATAPRRERATARVAAVPPPTEVHVSIGRVELTALPAAAPARAARPRDANAHGLGDYLRGSRGRS